MVWQQGTDKGSEQAESGAKVEEDAPVATVLWDEGEVDDGGEEVADGVSLLEDAGREAAYFDRQVFERGGGGEAPYAAHADAEEGADGEELLECLDEAGTQLDEGDDEEVGDEGPFATVTVRDDTEDDLRGGAQRE